jgi:Phr family secreted Rap phosphatase inhibitor
MINNKKKILYIVLAILVVLIIAGGVFFLFNNQKPTNSVPTEASANLLKTQALTAIKNKDSSKAEALLSEAQQQYQTLKDTNNVIDTAALLNMVENSKTLPSK